MTTSVQSMLFAEDTSTAVIELFPAIWSAAEGLASPLESVRSSALDHLVELQAPRFSPLIAYLLLTRLDDANLDFRSRIVDCLADVLMPDEAGRSAPDEVRNCLVYHLSRMRQRLIHAVLQVSPKFPELKQKVGVLYNHCPYAGSHLAAILASSKTPGDLRRMAVYYIGQVGYLDAIPILERLLARLEARQAGQAGMPFAPSYDAKEAALLPVVRETLLLLKSS